jgi:predicted Holliday junction resolvase-like endonuclease
MRDIELKIIVILVMILWAVMFFITGIRLINWQNEYKNKDEQIKLLEQSLNEQIEEKQAYSYMLENERSNT